MPLDGGAPAPTLPHDAAVGVEPFDDWVATVTSELLRFARVITHDVDPTDAVQDALVAVFSRWSRFADGEQAGAYARRVIVNSHISRWRRWGRHVTPVDPTLIETPEFSPALSTDAVVARQLLDTLPPRQRAAVYLRFYDDLTYREVAAVIGCREATARSHVRRALHQLNEHLSKDVTHG